MESITLTVPEENHLERIDRFLASSTESDISRSLIQKLIKDGNITVNESPIKANYKVKTDDNILITFPEPETYDLVPENIPLNILYEDDSIVVINKQPGLVVHPGPGNYSGTLVNALLYHIRELSDAGDPHRPGIVHRLDRDTSGLMVITKTNQAYEHFVNEFSSRNIYKKYTALVIGKPKTEHEIISRPVARHQKYRHKMTVTENGKEAVTEYTMTKVWHVQHTVYSMLDIRIFTGRTHQIRVHLSSMGNPVIGDQIYSKKWEKYKVPYLLLASTELAFTHPVSGEKMEFKVELPVHMTEYINRLDSMQSQ